MPSPTKPTNSTAYADVLAELKELLPQNYIGGLITSNDAGDADHDVNIAAGEARDPTDVESLRLVTEITKQIDAAWVVGDDAGGIDAGAVAANTLYAVWLVKRSDTGVVDALFSLSFTAPTMPTSYDFKRLIGAVHTDGGSDIIAFTQQGDFFRYLDPIVDVNDNTIVDDTFETGTLSVPPSSLAHVYASGLNSGTTAFSSAVFLRPVGGADIATANEAVAHIATSGTFDGVVVKTTIMVDESSQMEYAMEESDGDSWVTITTLGFLMSTRREP